MSYALPPREDPGRVAAGMLAVGMHVLLFTMLFFGINWQRRPPEPVVAELWSSLPPVPAAKAPEPPAPPAVKPPPPPEPKPEPKAEPKPAPKPVAREPEPAKADIALKDRQEKERLLKEKVERERVEKERVEKDRKATEDRTRRLAEEKERQAALEAEKAEKAKEAEKARVAKEQADAIRKVQEQQAAAQAKQIADAMAQIQSKVRRYVNKDPCSSVANAEILVQVTLLPGGETLEDPLVRRSSGNAACDRAIITAVLRAQPLPVPSDSNMFQQNFRRFELKVRPND